MHYDHFINLVKSNETKRIRAFRGKQQTNPEGIPEAFSLLIPELITILSDNLFRLCRLDEGLIVFGLQPAGAMISSNLPLKTERMIRGLQQDYHFCCTLDFFKMPLKDFKEKEEWTRTDSIIVDFTSGEIMNSERFLTKLNFSSEKGLQYGYISEHSLDFTWSLTRLKQLSDNYEVFKFNHILMDSVAEKVA